jgi:hypothetical protein
MASLDYDDLIKDLVRGEPIGTENIQPGCANPLWEKSPFPPAAIPPTLSSPAAIPQPECKHCDGAGVCNCPACNLRRTTDAVPCLMCHPLERQVWLAATRPEGCWHCSGSGECKCISCGNATCGVCGGYGKTRVN